jgi:hypothetical protein
VGTTASATEAAGCVPWEEHGNVEYNAKTEQPLCNVRGTCLCKGSDGREVQIIGMPKYGKGVEGRELQASSSSRGSRWRIFEYIFSSFRSEESTRRRRPAAVSC